MKTLKVFFTENPHSRWVILGVGSVLVLAINYGMALLGEPRALWLYRDILGVI